MKSIVLSTGLLAASLGTANADIYKYRDAAGNWQFADKAPTAQTHVEVINRQKAKASANNGTLLNPVPEGANALQTAANAVVSIQTPVGSGSGFFINENGYLLTNRHVVRPTENADWKKQEKALNSAEVKMAAARRALTKESEILTRHSKNLANYR